MNKLYTKLNDAQKFNLIGFTFIEMFTIEKFNDGYLAEKGDEKILVWKFIPSNDNGDDSYIDYMHNLHHKNPFRALGDFKEISFIDVNLKQLKNPEIIYDGNLLYDIIKNPEILAHKYYDPVAQNKIGKYYYYKDFTDSSKIIALEYFKKAANQNNPEAIFYIGQAYLTGILKDSRAYEIAMEYFIKSSDLGFQESTDFLRKYQLNLLKCNVKRVIIVGSILSGKSVFAQKLRNIYKVDQEPPTVSHFWLFLNPQ